MKLSRMHTITPIMHYHLILASIICVMSAVLSSCKMQNTDSKQILLEDSSSNVIKVKSLVADSIWIQLEDIPEAMIGDVKRIIEHDETIYILHLTSKKELIAFDCNGKYLNTIGQQGHGEGEYPDIIDFAVNTQSGEIAILAPNSTVYIYNPDGKFVKEYRHVTESLLWHITFNGEYYVCSTDHSTYTEGDNAFLLYTFTQDFQLVGKYIPVLPQQMPGISMFEGMLSTIGRNTYYMDMYNHTLYYIDKGASPVSILSFIMPDPMPLTAYASAMTFYQQQTTHDWIKTFLPLDNSFLLTYVIQGNLCIAEITKEGKPKFEGLAVGILPKMFPGSQGTILSPVTKEYYLEEWMNVPAEDITTKEIESNIMLLRWRLAGSKN